MIKINFLTSFKDYAAAQGGGVAMFDEDERNKILIDLAKRVAVIAIGPLGLYIYEMQTIPVLIAKRTEKETQLDEIKKFNESKKGLAAEIKKYEEESARFSAQADFIIKIQADKLNEYRLFRHLKDSTPRTVWITDLQLSGDTLLVSGESVDPADITIFTENLVKSDFIASLQPIGQGTKENYQDSGVTTTTFQFKAALKAGATK